MSWPYLHRARSAVCQKHHLGGNLLRQTQQIRSAAKISKVSGSFEKSMPSMPTLGECQQPGGRISDGIWHTGAITYKISL